MTVFEGHHQPLSAWILCPYFMGLNLSNNQIAQELELNVDDVQNMARQLRQGVVARKPETQLEGKVECDEVYVVAGHKGHPDTVKKRPKKPTEPPERCPRSRHIGKRKATNLWHGSAWRRGSDSNVGEC